MKTAKWLCLTLCVLLALSPVCAGALEMDKVSITVDATRSDIYPVWTEMTKVKELIQNASDYLELKWVDWPAASVSEKKSIAINSGDYGELLLGTWLLNTTEVANYAGQDILIPLEKFITPEIMPNLSATLAQRPEWVVEMTATDGHIYGLPSYNERTGKLRTINDTIMINTEWLAKVNMDMPTTTQEMYEVLKAFKQAGDLNGNGVDDEIPMSFFYGPLAYGNHQYGISSLLGWFGVTNNKKGITLKDGKPVYVGVQPEFKAAVSYFHRLYQDGLLD